jgi:adenine-specific DNA-methyltransferase
VKGFVLTPEIVVDAMVEALFAQKPPTEDSSLLDPGCGTGVFIGGVIRWCQKHSHPIPRIVGIELDIDRFNTARETYRQTREVQIRNEDFLGDLSVGQFDFIIGNPPYVGITRLDEAEKTRYRARYASASGRFDLYMLFFERAIKMLKESGRIVFITPEKFLYVKTAEPLRKLLSTRRVETLQFLDEATFEGLVTYPLVSTVSNRGPAQTNVALRDGSERTVRLPGDGRSWLPAISGVARTNAALTLQDVSVRISCGVATGADSVFVMPFSEVPDDLRVFAHPTLSGRQIHGPNHATVRDEMLIPYHPNGALISESELGPLAAYLKKPENYNLLMKRTCVTRKPWYAFHESPVLDQILRPKLLCKDIGAFPTFIRDVEGCIVPRHSAYYVIPRDPAMIDGLADYLNSPTARVWFENHCQRASKGFLRLQSHVLKRVPLPSDFAPREPALFESTLLTA